MFGIRFKLILGFGGLLATMIVIAMMTMSQIRTLGEAIDVILKENYKSVIACQNMKESLERIDSGILFSFADKNAEGQVLIDTNIILFRASLNIELGNITLPGEKEKADRILDLFQQFTGKIHLVTSMNTPLESRTSAYFTQVFPLFQEIKKTAQDILEMNQANMSQANDNARSLAASAYRQMFIAILICAAIAIVFFFILRQRIIKPISDLMESTEEIGQGNLDQVIVIKSHDEIGQLSKSFNEMVSALREARKIERINLIRSQQSTEVVVKALPSTVAVVDLSGMVETATETADHYFNFKPGLTIKEIGYDWLPELISKAIKEGKLVELDNKAFNIQKTIEGREYIFQPLATPIPTGTGEPESAGIAIIFKDITQI